MYLETRGPELQALTCDCLLQPGLCYINIIRGLALKVRVAKKNLALNALQEKSRLLILTTSSKGILDFFRTPLEILK